MDAATRGTVFYKFNIASPRWLRILLCSLFALLVGGLPAFALQSVTLAWDPSPEPNLAGYRLKYGTSSGSYTQTLEIGNTTTATVPNLSEGGTYFFVVTAVNSSSLESIPSNEVSFTIAANQPPAITMTSPGTGASAITPAIITLAATANDSDGTVVRVEFYSGTTKVGEDGSSPFSYDCTVASPGTYSFTARAFDDEGASAQSSPVTLTATQPPVEASKPEIASVTYSAAGGAQLTVTGTPGQSQSVFVSSDLKTWTLLASVVNSTGTLSVNDPSAANLNQRFYRVTDATSTSDTVGFTKLRIAGRTGRQTAAYSYLGINLVNPTSYQGTVSSKAPQSIVDAQADWTDDQFNGANGEFYLEIVSGPMAGLTTDILATNGATKTLTTDDDLSSMLSGGEQFKIRKHRTMGDVFGKNNEAKIKAGTTVSLSDEVRLFNPVTQSFLVHYYNTDVSGWRSSTDATTDTSDTKLYADQGVSICRKATGDVTLVVTGAVKTGQTIVPIGVNSNLCANLYPAGMMTLGNSGLYTGNTTTGLAGAAKLSNADEVQIWNGSTFRRYFYKTGTGGIGWRDSANLKADASGTQIPAGSAVYVVRKKGRAAFNWKMRQPF
jgi:hypothetical protein